MFILHVFLQCALMQPGGITEAHKGCWLLFQVAPTVLLEGDDIFIAALLIVQNMSNSSIQTQFQYKYEIVLSLLGKSQTWLFCVLDKVQGPAKQLDGYFGSELVVLAGWPVFSVTLGT